MKIFRFVASCSVDEDIIQRAKKKMVLDHLVIQSMDTTGKTVINGGENKKGGSVPFDKSEVNMILKFGAEDLFKTDESEEQDKEVDLDAILESAETREDEEAPQSEANKELLSAFKCTNIAFDENEDEETQEDEQDEQVMKDWSDIIPSAMIELHKPKTGIEAYSDPEELFNPIAKRKKRRNAKKKRLGLLSSQAAESSDNESLNFSPSGNEDQDETADSDLTDGEKEILKTLKHKSYKESGEASVRGKYSKKTVICLKCNKSFVQKKGLKKHMIEIHKESNFIFTPDNRLELSGAENGMIQQAAGGVPEKKKRGPPAANTRCFPCNKSFQHRLGYKAHLKKQHDGVEPPENLDPANLALPDDRISCLICHKKFNTVVGLKGHIQKLHLGLLGNKSAAKAETEDEEIEEEYDGEKESAKVEAKSVSAEEARLIEKMYYLMRRYGCVLCPVRFNNKSKLEMHERVHAKANKPVVCPYCEKSYSKRDKLKKHIEKIHPGLKMPDPSTPSPAKQTKGSPLRLSAKPVQNSPSPRSKIEMETVIVNGQSKFKCPKCDTLFSYQKGCVRHVKMFHNDETRRFACTLCPLKYNDSKGLYQHMHRKHKEEVQAKREAKMKLLNPKSTNGNIKMENLKLEPVPANEPTPEPESTDDEEDVDSEASEMSGSVPEVKTYDCSNCPKGYTNPGSLWAHKKSKHSDPSAPESPSQNKKKASQKDYSCPVCKKFYASYMSLYMHKKTKHPHIAPSGGSAIKLEENGSTPALPIELLNLTPKSSRREKKHQCAQCPKKYTDMKGLAGHIEKMHSGGGESLQSKLEPVKVPADCPYCPNTYSRRDKLYEHIRKHHPGEEVPKLDRGSRGNNGTNVVPPTAVPSSDEENSNSSFQSSADSNSGFGAGRISITPVNRGLQNGKGHPLAQMKPRGNQGGGRGKYKEKEFSCPHCNKGYCNENRLTEHIKTKHEKTNDPWANVGPNTDIAIKNKLCANGFEVFKVLQVYSTGLRLKAARFAPLEDDKWVLTEEVNKNVMKQDILKVVSFFKDDNVFTMEPHEKSQLIKMVSTRRNFSLSLVETIVNDSNCNENEINDDNGSITDVEDEAEEEEEEECYIENENGEVLVSPIFL